jgi:hypothetical protein
MHEFALRKRYLAIALMLILATAPRRPTIKVTEVEWVRLPLVPVIVRV